MSNIGSYKNTAFSEGQKFLVLDPATGSTSLVLGSSLIDYITPRLNSVTAETTRLSAENTDYDVGTLVQTAGATDIGDGLASVYLVVEGGTGDFPMINGNDLLVITGDDDLREQLISTAAGEGASLVSFEGGPLVQNGAVIRVNNASDGTDVSLDGVINALDFLSPANRWDVVNRTELFDHSVELLAAVQYAIDNNFALHMPAGVYKYGSSSTTGTRLSPTLSDGDSVVIFGDGKGKTIVKEEAGQNAAIGRFDLMWLFTAPSSGTLNNFVFSGMTLNKNGASNGAPPSPFDWEQSHCLSISGDSTSTIKNAIVRDIEIVDKVGGGVVFAAGFLEKASVYDLSEKNFSGLFGQRADAEFQATVKDLRLVNCSGLYVQSEPNYTNPLNSVTPVVKFVNCNFGIYDLAGYVGDSFAQQILLSNSQNTFAENTGDFWVRRGTVFADNCILRVSDQTDWRQVKGEFANSKIQIAVDTGTNTFRTLNISSVSLEEIDVEFNDCDFVADDTADAATTGFAVKNGSVVTAADIELFKVTFFKCRFSTIFERLIDGYRNGQWRLIYCELSSRSGGYVIQTGADATRAGHMHIENCDLTKSNGDLFRVAAASSSFGIVFRGTLDYSKYSALNRPPSEWEGFIINDAVWLADSRPSAGGYLDQKVRLRNPGIGAAYEFDCTTSSLSSATFTMSRQNGFSFDITSNRPSPNTNDKGLQYFDTTLDADGKPIWWNGTAWVDATGAVV